MVTVGAKLSKRIRASEKWIGIVADICVVLSIGIGILTYADQKRDSEALRRREAALQFAALRHDSAYAVTSEELVTALLKNDRLKVGQGNQEEFRIADAKDIILEVGAGKIDGLAMFYSSVISCEESNICESSTLRTIFKDDLTFFYCSTNRNILPILLEQMNSKNRYNIIKSYFDREIGICPTKATGNIAS